MVKYTYKTVAYVLPESIKKMNNDVRLHRAQSEKEQIKSDIAKKDLEINKATGSEKKRLEREKDELNNKLAKIENSIFNIKADLYGSSVNFSNNNIQNLSAHINDISSFIKGQPNISEDITKKISEILSNQIDINNIFNGINLKDMLQEILEKTDEASKNNYIDKFNKIKAAIDSIKDDSDIEKNKQIWNDIKKDILDLIPADKLEEAIVDKQKQIEDLKKMKRGLNKILFDKDVEDVDLKELNDFNEKSNLLNDLYNDLNNSGIVNKTLQRRAVNKENKGYKKINIEDGKNLKDVFTKINVTNDKATEAINNMRKWFTNDAPNFDKFKDSKLFMSINPFDFNLLKKENLKNIKKEDIEEANDVFKSILNYYNNDFFKNNTQTNNSENSNEDVSEGLSKGLLKQSCSGGLDLDEIHNMNIMNNIIQSLNEINETLKGIKVLMSKQSFSEGMLNQKLKTNERKLGRFKVEKYNPNMSITEFKKLFDKK